jgi:hypothetical protein
MAIRQCLFCGSDRLSDIAWRDLVPSMPTIDEILIYDGETPIPRTLTFCESCGEWLASSAERKQVDELIAAIRLVAGFPGLVGARLEHSDKPDIRVHLDGRIYGLEVTRIVRGGADAINRAQWRRVVERSARLLSRERDNPPVWVSMRWNPDPPRTNAQTLALALVELMEQHYATQQPKIHGSIDVDPQDVPDELAPYVHGLHIVRTVEDDHWVSGFANYPDVQPKELQDEIDKKALKASGYAPPKDGLWLLIYAESTSAAQALDITDEARSAIYTGPFQRAFFLDCMDKVGELNLR